MPLSGRKKVHITTRDEILFVEKKTRIRARYSEWQKKKKIIIYLRYIYRGICGDFNVVIYNFSVYYKTVYSRRDFVSLNAAIFLSAGKKAVN